MRKNIEIEKYDKLLLGIKQIPHNHGMLLLCLHRTIIQLKLL